MPFKTANIDLYIYNGIVGVYGADDLKYRLKKDVIGDDNKAVVEVAELIRDYITHTFNGTTYSAEPKWVSVKTGYYDENDNRLGDFEVENFLAFDGYGKYEEGINPELSRHVLISNRTVYVAEGETPRIPVFTEGLPSVTYYNASGSNIGTQTISDGNDSADKVVYLTVPTGTTKIVSDSEENETTIKIEYVCEPKYTPHRVTFINRLGVLQDLWCFKKHTTTLSLTDKTFKANTIDIANETYNVQGGQVQRYNVGSTKSISMNTGFMEEGHNEVIEELLHSENVWIKYEGTTLPVLVKSKSLQYKTEQNDRLINYSLDFEFAFERTNKVR